MKVCKYNFFVPHENRIICFNALSGRVFSVNDKEYLSIQHSLETPNIKTDIRDFLYKAKFIIDDHFDETEYIILHNRIEIFDRNYHLIINPTLECNFNCWYCYEKTIKGSISEETIQNIMKFITNRVEKREITGLKLNWFGGEPLLHYKRVIAPISLFAKKLMDENHLFFSNGITTNAYLINDKMIDDFKLIDLNFFQITLDGGEESHNRTRNQRGRPSYKKIIDNIIKLCKSTDSIRIRLRINYTNEILQQNFKEIFDNIPIEERKKITIDFQRVWQTAHEVSLLGINTNVISKVELAREMGFASGLDSKYTVGKFYQCYVDKYYHAHINYDGKVYKCSARNYSDKYICGELLNTGEIQWRPGILERMYTKANFENTECLSCKLLPLCIGPCYQNYLDYKNKENPSICIHRHKEIDINTFIIEYYKNIKKKYATKMKENFVSTVALSPEPINKDTIDKQ